MSQESNVSFEFPYEVESHLKEMRERERREMRHWSAALPTDDGLCFSQRPT